MDKSKLDRLFRPDSVAIVGASPQRGSPRNSLLRVVRKHGFAGAIYPVTPTHDEVEGLRAYKSVVDLPDAPDVALIITPAHTVPDIVAQCGAKGIRNAIVFSAGFEETEEGKEHARRLAEVAESHDVTLLGPNCQGIWSVLHRSMLTYGPALMNLDTVQHAPIAIVSQSGALGGAIANSLQQNGMGCSYVVSVGNETCLDALDALEWIIAQDDVRVVALYIEGLTRAGRILRIAHAARERGVQIVALKAGRSDVGQQATASHTGKIASSHAVYADVFEQAGVISVGSLAEALAAMEVLAYLPNPRLSRDPKGGISVLSMSGGAGALLADHSSEFGIPMTEFSAATAERLRELLPAFARKANPIDLTGQINTVEGLFRNTCLAVAADPRTEAVVVQFASSGRRWLHENADDYKLVARDVPVALSFVGETMERDLRSQFRQAGVLLASDPQFTMQALALLYARARLQSLAPVECGEQLPPHEPPADWQHMMRFCEGAGIQPASWRVLEPRDRATDACRQMKYPLVVKVLPQDAEHKTELGLVKLRVRSPGEVDRLAGEFRARLGKPAMGVLVQEMVDEGVEVVLACLRQTDFGPLVSIGSGGVAIELYRDVVHLALPVSPGQVVTAMKKLKLWKLLQGFRGKPAADVDTLAAAAARLGDMFLATPKLLEFEINPVIVRPRGHGVFAVDALASIERGGSQVVASGPRR